MPYTPKHKAETRARIIESARILFNRRGFERVSIDDIMAEAGLTRGGFYNHFASKDLLYAEAVHSFTTNSPFSKRQAELRGKPSTPRERARMLVDMYLSDQVLTNVDYQCPLIALPSDVARAGKKPRAAYTALVGNMARLFRAAMSPKDREAERKALLMVNLCVGGMIIARTTDDPALRESLRAAARLQALKLLGE